MDIPTFQELYQAFREEVESRNPALTDWNEGSNLDALAGASAVLADEFIRWGWSQFGAQFMDLASGTDLDALVLDRFGLTRKPAAAAVGILTFTRGTSSGTITIPAGTVVEGTGADGETVQVETDADVQLLDGSSTVEADATCTATGRAGNVAAGVLTDIPTPVPADPNLTVTNAARFAGGGDAESDDQLRSRARRYFQTLRKGTVEALEAGALQVPGVSYVAVGETHILPDAGGYVDVFVADQDGYGNATLAALVLATLSAWRAAGVWVQVSAATREETAVSAILHVESGADTDTIRSDAITAILAYTDGLVPGETLRLSQLFAACHGVSDDVLYVEISPNSDVAPSSAQHILRVPSTSLSVTVVES